MSTSPGKQEGRGSGLILGEPRRLRPPNPGWTVCCRLRPPAPEGSRRPCSCEGGKAERKEESLDFQRPGEGGTAGCDPQQVRTGPRRGGLQCPGLTEDPPTAPSISHLLESMNSSFMPQIHVMTITVAHPGTEAPGQKSSELPDLMRSKGIITTPHCRGRRSAGRFCSG